MSNARSAITEVLELLQNEPERYSRKLSPHPKAKDLVMPDGSKAPGIVIEWAAFDNRYPTYLSNRRSALSIASRDGVVKAKPMKQILKWACLDSIRDELEDDEETLVYLRDLVKELAEELPGYGVLLDRSETPDRVLWYPPGAEPIAIWYKDDAFTRREPFGEWVAGLFRD